MKYLIVVPDGAADEAIEALQGRTPFEAADMPHIDALARKGTVGLVDTIPAGMPPGSDVANLSVMGFDPAVYHTGRSPLEAVSMGIDMAPTDVAFRCNLVTLGPEDVPYEDMRMIDNSAGEISSAEAAELIAAVEAALGTERLHFYPGVSYRHALIENEGSTDVELTPPHDILDRRVGDYLPRGADGPLMEDLMRRSFPLLKEHPVNLARIAAGKRPANSIWIWGQGRKPALPPFQEKYGVDGSVISAVDLIKGIGLCAGLESIDVEGATGTVDTNYAGKAAAAIDAFRRGKDFVYVHLEATDESSHQGDLAGKIRGLERIDAEIVAPILQYLEGCGEAFRVLVLPDHYTPLRIRTHAAQPVPYLYYGSEEAPAEPAPLSYCEKEGEKGPRFASGYALAAHFFRR